MTAKYNRNRNKYTKKEKVLLQLKICCSSAIYHRFSFEYFNSITTKFITFMKKAFGKHYQSFENALMSQILMAPMKKNCKKVEFYTLSAEYQVSSNASWQTSLGIVTTIAVIVNDNLSNVCIFSFDGRNLVCD